MNLIMCGVILVAMPFVNYAMHPDKEHAVTIDPALLKDEAAHFGTMIVLLDSAMRDGDLTELLRPLGTYTHYEPMLAVHAPPVLMPLVKAKAWQATPEPGRLRVRPQDVRGRAAVLFGASGSEIIIADSLR